MSRGGPVRSQQYLRARSAAEALFYCVLPWAGGQASCNDRGSRSDEPSSLLGISDTHVALTTTSGTRKNNNNNNNNSNNNNNNNNNAKREDGERKSACPTT